MEEKENSYIINGGEEGKIRLKVLSDLLSQNTKSLLEIYGPITGLKVLDIGCGGGDVSLMAAKMVSDTGSVVGVDFDKEIICLAEQDALKNRVNNVSFQVLDVVDISFNNEFDIVFSRFLMSHLNQPLKALNKMLKSLKVGGKIITEDVQFSGHFCHPPCLAFEKYIQFYADLARSRKQNSEIGLSLFELFRQAGIKNINFDVIQPCFNKGEGKWMAYITLDKIKETLIKEKLADRETIQQVLKELEDFTKDETTIISLPRIFRVWGVKE
ncbi:MAG TPA: class I SAM-dependent methyltransferase [Saprospiraceae bacterium]|nr:class I SAM-dependent methyltransferase [Saprospiraceae bacterium]